MNNTNDIVGLLPKHNKTQQKTGLLKKGLVLLSFYYSSTLIIAADTFSSLDSAGATSKTASQSMLKNWIWVFAFIPFAIASFLAFLTYDKLTQKESQSQEQTKLMKWVKVVSAFIFGTFMTFVLYGIFGTVFAGEASFMDAWNHLVTDYFSALFTS